MRLKQPILNREGIEVFAESDASEREFDYTFFDCLYNIEEKNFWFRGRREAIFQILKRFIPDYKNKKMLEVGCGGGNIVDFLKGKGMNIEGADIFFEGLQFARKRVNTNFYQINIKDIPFKNEFDLIGLFDVLEHVQEEEQVLVNVYKALKPEGHLFISVPALPLLWSYFDKIACHKRRYTKRELANKLKKQGFSIIKATYLFMLLLPIMTLKRKINPGRFSGHPTDLLKQELSCHPIFNLLFYQLARLESLLIPTFSFPLGSSLLILAKKNNAIAK
jgi:2-polyprenyl-3-methyl-5-hydroxy-6-metoxy-1,4-benzoquinol methylase